MGTAVMTPGLSSPGFWGTPTSNVDFCEPNYEVSHYVAEFWNTITSIPIILVGVSGVVLCHVQRLGAEQMLAYSLVGIVGIGSCCFHATLMRTGQILDEVPMLWAALSLLYGAYHHIWDRRRRHATNDHRRSQDDRSPPRRPLRLVLVACALAAYACASTLVYVYSGFLFFIIAYAASVTLLIVFAIVSMLSSVPAIGPTPRRVLAAAGLTYGGGAVLLWLPAELACHHIPLVRRLPLHALFHLTSAAGPHLGLTAFALARFDDERQTGLRSSVWFGGLPAIDRGDPGKHV